MQGSQINMLVFHSARADKNLNSFDWKENKKDQLQYLTSPIHFYSDWIVYQR